MSTRVLNLKKNIKIENLELKNFINLDSKEMEIVRNWRNDYSIRKWCYTEKKISPEEHFKFIKKLKEDNKKFYWIVKDNDNYIGVVNLYQVDFENKNAYLGIYSNPQLKGVGNKLIFCLKEVAFKIVRLHTLKIGVIKDNNKAINFFKKSGFNQEGELKDYINKKGKYVNVIVMGLINDYDNKN